MKNIYESIIVFGVITGLLLPVRLIFVSYVYDNWIGSFGVISITILILAKKGKIGEIGNMIQRQFEKLLKGKHKILVYVKSVFVLTLLGGMIFTISQANTVYPNVQNPFFY